MKQVYLDYSATTPIKEEVLEAMMPYLKEEYGNPSNIYSLGIKTKKAISESRGKICDLINANENEIYFTGSGSEADNWAIIGILNAHEEKGKHIVASKIEHHAILNTLKHLETKGYEVTYLDVRRDGILNPDDFKNALRKDTVLVSIMLANNEIGTIQPIEKLAKIAHENGTFFHCDGVQALSNIPIDVKKLDVDMMAFSAHKLHGPKGIGALYIKKGIEIDNFVFGGNQEMGKRAGTENVAGIVGFGKAAQLAKSNMENHIAHCLELRNYLADEIYSNIFHSKVNGSMLKRLPGNLNISFSYIEGESILLMLNQLGISVSTGSACSSGEGEPSHVLKAIGVDDSLIHGTVRFSIGDFTTKEDIDYVVSSLKTITDKLLELSPLYKG
ncbi:MAG TPA: cysteine desulfurase NifS [Anaerovoracaceae bacterium]|nr:cysteine desulfurase NifS [Anaerovoracaceae bacterium]